MNLWNEDFIEEVLKSRKLTKEQLREYTKKLIEFLEKKATEKDYYVASPVVYDLSIEVARELGYDYVKKRCEICGREVYVLNVKTKAKIICIFCKVRMSYFILNGMGGCVGGM